MRRYVSIYSARVRMLLQYRAAALAGLTTQVFFGFIKVMVFEAFYRSSSAPMPMTLVEVVTYIWLGQATLAVLPWNLDPELSHQVKSGAVVYELLRPVDLYGQWYARSLALRTAPAWLRAVPMFIFAGLLLPWLGQPGWAMQPPASMEALLLWCVAMVVAVAIAAALTMLWNISLMWTLSGDGARHLAPALVTIFSGMIVPLPLFPGWAQAVMEWLPFAGVVDIPARIFVGHIEAAEAWPLLLRQALWAVVLVALGRWLLGRGLRRLVVQGG